MTLGIAIPVGHEDIEFLPRILNSIDNSTLLPNKVVISVSGVRTFNYNEKHNFELIVKHSFSQNGVSKNRNIASSYLDTDVISFMDADDTSHPQRNEYIMEAMKTSDVVVHNYLPTKEMDENFLKEKYESPLILQDYIDETLEDCKYPVSSNEHKPYTCGHLSIKKNLMLENKFDETLSYGEDAEFLKNIVLKGTKITLIENKLSNYIK